MTTITTVSRRRAPSPVAWFELPLGPFRAALETWRSFKALRRLESMPDHILKDIGWPASDADR